jgi:hypothetical protein
MKPVFALWATPGTLRLQLHRGCATRSCRRSVVHQVGLEPTKLSQRLKRPLPLPLGALVCIGLPSRTSRSEQIAPARLRSSSYVAAAFARFATTGRGWLAEP